LLEMETRDGHLSTTPVSGWAAGEPRPGFDQQPIEAAAIADACMRALVMTRDAQWADGLRLSVNWFLGDNDTGIRLITEAGGGNDGLGPTGCSRNQGAESTLAMLSTLQHARALSSVAAPPGHQPNVPAMPGRGPIETSPLRGRQLSGRHHGR
jgi:hypothetical protein